MHIQRFYLHLLFHMHNVVKSSNVFFLIKIIVVNLDIPEAEDHNNKLWIDDIHSNHK